jgi:DNA-binding beta-propeller fold protein YncE
MKRFPWLGFVLFVYILCTGCGETFRPIIIPNPPVFPNPKAAHTVLSINSNPTCLDSACDNGLVPLAGTALAIDVSGDTEASIANSGIAPVHAVQQAANEVLVVNQAVTGLTPPPTGCSVTVGVQTYNVCPSLTELSFSSSTTIAAATTISLPVASAPNFVAVAPSSTTAYVTLPNYIPDPVNHPTLITPSVGVVSTVSASLEATIPVGSNPYALAVTPNNMKLYVANQGSSTISAFNTADRSQRVGSPIAAPSPPIWLNARSDSQQVYVLEQSGALEWLDTTSTAGPDQLSPTSISVPGAIKMTYDGNLNRLYIPGGSQVAIVDVSQPAPASIATVSIATVAPGSRSASDPCSMTAAGTLNTVDVAALPDGSRAYAGSYYEDANGNICPQVTVIDAVSNTAKSPPIAIPGFAAFDAFCSPAQNAQAPRFRIMMAAGGDSSRAYLSSCDGGNINIIDTSSDSYIASLFSPIGSRTVPNTTLNPPQNPVFLLAGP